MKKDQFAAIRELFEHCNKIIGKTLIANNYLFLDEKLYSIRNQFVFKQYDPDKPVKYGLLFKPLYCVQYPCTFISHVYCEKSTDEPDEYYITGTYNYLTSLVNNIE